jgi:hypothetical protein
MRLLPLALLLAALASGCAPPTAQVERAIERELPRTLGPADSYRAEVTGLRLASGEASRVAIVGQRVRPEDAPVLDRLDLDLYGVRFSPQARRVERADSARGTVRITAADLVDFLGERQGVREATLTLSSPDRATIRLRPELGGLPVPRGVTAEATGRLRAEDGHVHFEVEAVRAGGLDLGSAAARTLSDTINPLVDLTDRPGRLRVRAVRVENGALILDATGDVSGLVAPR